MEKLRILFRIVILTLMRLPVIWMFAGTIKWISPTYTEYRSANLARDFPWGCEIYAFIATVVESRAGTCRRSTATHSAYNGSSARLQLDRRLQACMTPLYSKKGVMCVMKPACDLGYWCARHLPGGEEEWAKSGRRQYWGLAFSCKRSIRQVRWESCGRNGHSQSGHRHRAPKQQCSISLWHSSHCQMSVVENTTCSNGL